MVLTKMFELIDEFYSSFVWTWTKRVEVHCLSLDTYLTIVLTTFS